jgi:competence protein ComEA
MGRRGADEYTRVPDIVVPHTWRDRLQALAGRRRHSILLVGGAVLVVFIALANYARQAPATIAPPATAPGDARPSPDAPAVVAGETILVHVAGAVHRPGLYEMPADARIADAVEAARGPRGRADLDALNLAESLTDGQKIDVPKVGEAAAVTSPGAPSAPTDGAPGAVIDLNLADQAALETIPGVGPVTAGAILAYRDEVGSFTSIEQLLEVTGIGPATLEAIRPYVTL